MGSTILRVVFNYRNNVDKLSFTKFDVPRNDSIHSTQ